MVWHKSPKNSKVWTATNSPLQRRFSKAHIASVPRYSVLKHFGVNYRVKNSRNIENSSVRVSGPSVGVTKVSQRYQLQNDFKYWNCSLLTYLLLI